MPADGNLDELVNDMERTVSNNRMVTERGQSKGQTSFHPGCVCLLPESRHRADRVAHLHV